MYKPISVDSIYSRKYGFKLTVDKGYLYDSLNLSDKTRIYLVRGDQIKLLSYKNNFYKMNIHQKKIR